MRETTCRICTTGMQKAFTTRLLNTYDVNYFSCAKCGFLQTEEPYWLDEAYGSPMAASDTGGLLRSLGLADCVSVLLYFFFDRHARFLDYAGGYGLFTRRMRDIGFDFFWQDRYTPNLFARGFEYEETLGPVELITSFESFEHFRDPLAEIEKMLSLSENILFTTELLPDPVPRPGDWHYYGLEHGQHISFYAARTLDHIARELSLHYYAIGPLHMFTKGTISLHAARFMQRLGRFGLSLYVRRAMQSKTTDDSILLRNRAYAAGNDTAGKPGKSVAGPGRNG